jgi:hypothetical protein
MGYWIVEAKNGALRGVRSELPGDRLSLPAVRLQLEVLGCPTEIGRQQVDPGTRRPRIANRWLVELSPSCIEARLEGLRAASSPRPGGGVNGSTQDDLSDARRQGLSLGS